MILKTLVKNKENNKKSLSILIDPDKIYDTKSLAKLVDLSSDNGVDYFMIGGSLIISDNLSETVKFVKNRSEIPVILFPGSNLHIDKSADAILFLSLISGRNPEFLIGQHVIAAPVLKISNLEILSTGYILVGNNANTTVAHISQTFPIPTRKPEIAVCTAIAGEMLGMKLIYLDAGSGASEEVPQGMIEQVRKSIELPLIVGGGINTLEKVNTAYKAGADMLVLGTAVEDQLKFIGEVAGIKDQMNR